MRWDESRRLSRNLSVGEFLWRYFSGSAGHRRLWRSHRTCAWAMKDWSCVVRSRVWCLAFFAWASTRCFSNKNYKVGLFFYKKRWFSRKRTSGVFINLGFHGWKMGMQRWGANFEVCGLLSPLLSISVLFLHAYLSIGRVWWLYTCHCERQWQYYFKSKK